VDVLIVGGGIGGLVAGRALQLRGLDAHVFEAAPELRAVGAGIWVPPNAMRVLAELELATPVRDAGLALDRVEIRDMSGGVLQAIEGAEAEEWSGFPTVAIRRSELQRVLSSALAPGTLHLGKKALHYENAGETVRVSFDDGSQAEGTLLVGADGIRSAIRRQMLPDASLRYSGQTCFRGLADLALPPELRRTAWEIWGGASRFGFSGVGGDAVYWFAPITERSGTSPRPPRLKAELLSRYSDFPGVVVEIIRATPDEAILQTDLRDLPTLSRWTDERVVLLGDAAHAMTPNLGQGGAQAIEDAASLARVLGSRGLVKEALAAYEAVRRPRTAKIARLSWHFGKMAHWENSLLVRARNTALRATPARMRRRQMDDLFTARL
jgi:2-polyprenyl-6-methoxyphenol hydroxylase-like FAD-dependent oxidoreductase